ncbi:MAG: RrF2 family transcriptional regulator [Verrucomicrobiales bacterium]
MNMLSMTTGYAVSALSLMVQRPDEYILIRDIAEVTGVPAPYLSKVAQRLVDLGLLESKRGYRGGVRLAVPAEELTILRIDEALDMGDNRPRCLLGGVECSDERACPAHEFWKSTRKQIQERLASLTLADVTAFEKHKTDFTPFNPVRRERKVPKKYRKRKTAKAPVSKATGKAAKKSRRKKKS